MREWPRPVWVSFVMIVIIKFPAVWKTTTESIQLPVGPLKTPANISFKAFFKEGKKLLVIWRLFDSSTLCQGTDYLTVGALEESLFSNSPSISYPLIYDMNIYNIYLKKWRFAIVSDWLTDWKVEFDYLRASGFHDYRHKDESAQKKCDRDSPIRAISKKSKYVCWPESRSL